MRHIGTSLLATFLALVMWDGEVEERVIREPDREVTRKETRMDFNDSLIDGSLVKPEEGYIPGSGRISFESLIELRKDFFQEIETSTKNL